MQLHSLLLQVPTALYDEPFLDNTPHPAINRSEEDVVLFNSRSFVRTFISKPQIGRGNRRTGSRREDTQISGGLVVVDWW